MCNTKRKIADGLLEMLHEKPLRKITVQDIMDCKDMKRQSFYYHFQDIYGVIEWMCNEDFLKLVTYKEEEEFDEWFCRVISIIKEKRFFLRKVLENIDRERMIERIYPVVEPQVKQRIIRERSQNDMVIRFTARSICHFILDCVAMRKGPEEADIIDAVQSIGALLQPVGGTIFVISTPKTTLRA
ncbi:MAG: hypothetical protein RSD28_02625 [Lachnospiraceae bacterium]